MSPLKKVISSEIGSPVWAFHWGFDYMATIHWT